jgi:hypothetical protein
MVQAVSRRPLTVEVRVRARDSPYEICGGQVGTGTGFSPRSLSFSCSYHSTVALHTRSYITWWMNNKPVGGHSSEA